MQPFRTDSQESSSQYPYCSSELGTIVICPNLKVNFQMILGGVHVMLHVFGFDFLFGNLFYLRSLLWEVSPLKNHCGKYRCMFYNHPTSKSKFSGELTPCQCGFPAH